MNKHSVVPKLRFKEFEGSGDWCDKILEELIVLVKPQQKITSNEYLKDGLYPIVDQSKNYNVGWTNNKKATNNKNLPLIVFGDHTCILKLIYKPFAQGADGIKIFYPNKKYLTTIFLYQFLSNDLIKTEGYKRHFKILRNKSIKYPLQKKEQNKIAKCLTSIDELISATTQKVEQLENHKRYLLQNLLPQEGQKRPRIRFKEFEGSTDWSWKKLGDICDITNGKANSQDHLENGTYPLFDRSVIIKKSKNYLFDCKAVIIPGEGMKFEPKFYEGKFNLHQRAYALNKFNSIPKFIYYTMASRHKLLADKAVLSTLLSLRKPIIEKFEIPIPQKQEQNKIAKCLTSIDDLISATTQKVEQLKNHKRYLLQNLLINHEDTA